MDKRQKSAVAHYHELIKKSENLASTVGRSVNELGMATDICADIEGKLGMLAGQRILEIGCGYGELTQYMLELYKKYQHSVVMLDIEPVINSIKENFSPYLNEKIELIDGIFPYESNLKETHKNSFDYIIAYSVIHYTDNPKAFILNSLDYLAPGGKLLIADLPNENKRGRFLATEFGRKFEAEWKGINLDEIPKYSDHKAYQESGLHNTPQICDAFIFEVFQELRDSGFDVFLLPQNNKLPYHYTREDLLIVRPPE